MIFILYTHINKKNHKNLLENYLPKFSIAFQEKILRYRRWEDAQLSLLGRVLLKKGMQKIDKPFNETYLKTTHYKKPYLENTNTKFNISHSGEVVVCAVTDIGNIGIDIEKIRTVKITDFKSQMTVNERNKIVNSSNKTTSFYKYWTQKEAVIKAHGKGLSIPLNSFEINANKAEIHSQTFFLKKITLLDNYSCYLAVDKNIDGITIEIVEVDSMLL